MLLRFRARLPYCALALGLLATSCARKEDAAPAGAITGTMAPVAGVGQLLKATAIAADKTEYTATLDPQTGAFSFPALPPGRYEVHFETTAAKPFPRWVNTTVVAGATATPQIPPITHDNIGRGTLKWTLNGKTYAATEFIKVYGDGAYFSLLSQLGTFGTSAEVRDIFIALPEGITGSKLFAGAGTYTLGGAGQVVADGSCRYYFNSRPENFADYMTQRFGVSKGTVYLTRYDAEQGIAVGTLNFDAILLGIAGNNPGVPAQAVVTQGEFAITF